MSNVNVQTMIDARNLSRTNELLGRSLNRLSSGTRIVRPSDDPGSIGTAGKIAAQNKRVQAASINVQNAVSFVQSSTGFMQGISQVLSRMSELGQYASDVLKSPADLALYDAEFKQLQQQLRQTIGGTTAEIGGTEGVDKPLGSFNGIVLFGPNSAGMTVASSSQAGDNIVVPEANLRQNPMLALFAQDAGGNFLLSVTSPGITQQANDAIGDLGDKLAILGAVGSRLEFASSALMVEGENLGAALSRIQDVDIAAESTRMTRYNILAQSGTAMLSQANQAPKSVLKLLEG